MLARAPLVPSLSISFSSELNVLAKEGDEIARDECEEKEQQTFDSHVVINLISVRTRADQKCTYLQRALILSRVKLKTRRFEPRARPGLLLKFSNQGRESAWSTAAPRSLSRIAANTASCGVPPPRDIGPRQKSGSKSDEG